MWARGAYADIRNILYIGFCPCYYYKQKKNVAYCVCSLIFLKDLILYCYYLLLCVWLECHILTTIICRVSDQRNSRQKMWPLHCSRRLLSIVRSEKWQDYLSWLWLTPFPVISAKLFFFWISVRWQQVLKSQILEEHSMWSSENSKPSEV